MIPQKFVKPLIWGGIVIVGTGLGKMFETKNFGPFEAFVGSLVIAGFVTAAVDANSLPSTTTSGTENIQ